MHDAGGYQHVDETLRRDIKLVYGDLRNAVPSNSCMSWDIISSFMATDVFMRRSKGFHGWKANFTVTVRTSVSPYIGGAYYFFWDLTLLRNPPRLDINDMPDGLRVRAAMSRPGQMLYISDGQEIQLTLPWFLPHEYMALGSGYNLPLLRCFAVVDAFSVADLDPPVVPFTFFLRLDDLEFTNLVPQSSKKKVHKDEYTGVVSAPAAVIGRAASVLSEVPILKPMASITSQVANGVAKVAALFGFSRPHVDLEPSYTTPMLIGSLSTGIGKQPCYPLTTNPKCERGFLGDQYGGMQPVKDGDPLAFANFLQRESLVAAFTTGNGVISDIIYTIPVTPCVGTYETDVNLDTVVQLTPIGHACAPFRWWRGSLVYTFKFVTTSFNRGRFRIFWTPGVLTTTAALPVSAYSYSAIVDLSTSSEYEITVNYMSPAPYSVVSFTNIPSAQPVDTVNSKFNGNLYLECIESPNAIGNNSIGVIVTVRAGDDFELACPDLTAIKSNFSMSAYVATPTITGLPGSLSDYATVNALKGKHSGYYDPPYLIQSQRKLAVEFGKPGGSRTDALVGESFNSFRPYLQRYDLYRRIYSGITTGWLALAVHYHLSTPGVIRYVDETPKYMATDVDWTLESWLQQAFLGCTGSKRVKMLVNTNYSGLERPATVLAGPAPSHIYWDTTASLLTYISYYAGRGMQVFNQRFGEAFSWVMQPQFPSWFAYYVDPYYTAKNQYVDNWSDVLVYHHVNSTAPNDVLTEYRSIGEDFQFVSYFGPPPMYLAKQT